MKTAVPVEHLRDDEPMFHAITSMDAQQLLLRLYLRWSRNTWLFI